MRLKTIKLAGFKSFVDPTSVRFPGDLTAIVGPNGCGKSNIIDAVRWVMGESSAKHLRGESMADVIFNGSGGRKPVGQASIELVFDNSDGSLGGEFAAFNEIALRRTVSRDGLSHYFLNGTRCRRRDITDIFLGTGLGPRSYAIIEQGMISRLIEARPEELRVYIEEAAGISKYKERRRDTENRMRRTRENLERLTDLREELDRQLQHLKRQASAAQRYGELRAEERRVRAELLALQWRAMDQAFAEQRQAIAAVEVEVEALNARHTGVDARIERHRERHGELGEALNGVQERYYALGSELARIEQAIQYQLDRARQLRTDLDQARHSHQQAADHIEEDEGTLAELRRQLDTVAPALDAAEQRESAAVAALQEAEQRMHRWQQDWDGFNQAAQQPQQRAQVLQSRIGHLEEALAQGAERLQRLETEERELNAEPVERELQSLRRRLEALDGEQGRIRSQSEALGGQLESCRERQTDLQERRQQVRDELQVMRGREASLEALQQAALGETDATVVQWIEAQGLDRAERLVERLDVAAGWETAVETVLGQLLQAVCSDGLDGPAQAIDSLSEGSVALFAPCAEPAGAAAPLARGLAQYVRAGFAVDDLFAGVLAADSLEEALRLRAQLDAGQSVVTRDGLWLGRDWLRLRRDQDAAAGVLARRRELDDLGEQIAAATVREQELGVALESVNAELERVERERGALEREQQRSAREYAELRAELGAGEASLEQMRLRQQRSRSEQAELRDRAADSEQEVAQARRELESCLQQMEQDSQRRESLLAGRDEVRAALERARDLAREGRDSTHGLEMQRQSLETRIASLQSSIERTRGQYRQLQSRTEQLDLLIADAEQPVEGLRTELDSKLEERLAVEERLAGARRELQDEEHRLREAERERQAVEQEQEQVRTRLERHRLEAQGLQVRVSTVLEQIGEAGFEVGALLAEMAEDASEDAWQQELTRLGNAIQRLGPINLAAIDEYKTQSERKAYLDAQNADLEEALTTLENAIRRIDRETRTRFKETFDKVNQGLKDLFPRVFGGGHAYLELTGDDLLSTGVAIMARPPGKRNATIHLLSGGEKALTAIALVFSIFQLNPSPFCMLDEVDAPLDDANVGRFARLVREMSERVQFIVITHNKITMEIAGQLMGVTMHEPGVSRLVSVDVDEAVELAQTA
jgi:chromosome segregation protein